MAANSDIQAALNFIQNNDPTWLFESIPHHTVAIQHLPHADLKAAALKCSHIKLVHNKPVYINAILDHLHRSRLYLSSLTTAEIRIFVNKISVSLKSESRFTLICAYYESVYGTTVASALRIPSWVVNTEISVPKIDHEVHVPWLKYDLSLHANRIPQKIPLTTLRSVLRGLHMSTRPIFKSSSKMSCWQAILCHLWQRSIFLLSANDTELMVLFFSLKPFATITDFSHHVLVLDILKCEYGSDVLLEISRPFLSKADNNKKLRLEKKMGDIATNQFVQDEIIASWPEKVSQDTIFQCLNNYLEGTMWSLPQPCAICSRQRIDTDVIKIDIPRHENNIPINLEMLLITDQFIIKNCVVHCLSNEFIFGHDAVDGMMLHKNGVALSENGDICLHICVECNISLSKNEMPRFALANNLYRGCLPSQFSDLTWVEEMVCAKYRNTAHITRLFQSTDPALPNVLHGNTCAHDMNVISTASVLPRTPADVNGALSIVFIGPGNFHKKFLKSMFRVRKHKIWQFLVWLTNHNKFYTNIPIDHNILAMYPDDGALPGIESMIIKDNNSDAKTVFSEETAGLSEHPAELLEDSDADSDEPFIFLEKMGVSDPEGDKLSGRTFVAAALCNLVQNKADTILPDLILHHGSTAIKEYNNPNLMPGMFPTLYPFGIGGFEDKDRQTSLSFQKQANYYFDIIDRCFRYHHSYMFVVLNILQRRASHLHTYFTVRKSNFDKIAQKLISISPEVLVSTAKHLEQEGRYKDLDNSQKEALDLLKHVNTVAAHIPGSQASKILIRNEIRSYSAYFGLPHLFLTVNPSAVHSPIFQVMFGDKTVDLTQRFPQLVPSRERAIRLAKDPVAAADFFDFSVTCLFKYLFGWDYKKCRSLPEGGILGYLKAFYGTGELTERGGYHGHFLLWLLGGLNPSELHQRLKENATFKDDFFEYFEDIIHHHLPDIGINIDTHFEPRMERPPLPPDNPLHPALDELENWNSAFVTEIKKCGEILQRHKCRPVCHKYGNEGKCRFLFPHEVVEASYFEPETNSVILLCQDSTVNYFNPYILVFCRHNHDLKCILSGKAAKGAMFYITDYITKMDAKTYQMLSLLSRAVSSMPEENGCSPGDRAKTLLHKCLTQFTRQQQIHAQQAARYIRGHGDGISSHLTIPMMTSILLHNVKLLYMDHRSTQLNDGMEHDDDDDNDDIEQISLRITLNKEGKLLETNQFHDYYYRAESLASMNFFDFCCCVKLEKISSYNNKNTHETRLGVLVRHKLLFPHKLVDSHQLVEHRNNQRGDGNTEYIPRVVGCSIPRPGAGSAYAIFVLVHFKPFGVCNPLLSNGETFDDAFRKFKPLEAAQYVINNWSAIDECEDARDAERLKKKAAMISQSHALTKSIFDSNDRITLVDSNQTWSVSSKTEFIVNQHIYLLQQSQWFFPHQQKEESKSAASVILPVVTDVLLKRWQNVIKKQEALMTSIRRNKTYTSQNNAPNFDTNDAKMTHTLPSENYPISSKDTDCPKTDTPNIDNKPPSVDVDPETVIHKIGIEFKLNSEQWIAFKIIARTFIKNHLQTSNDPNYKPDEPLRLVLTGPGGTGKTHVVKALRAVMAVYGCDHLLRFLAPTGSAALIDGMTIHKGLGIKIHANDKGKGNRHPGNDGEDYTVLISIHNRTILRDEWGSVKVLLLDEFSLLSEQLLCELDHALRYATECPDKWFGGLCVIFAGDFFQYPPVGGTPLYTPISCMSSSHQGDIPRRLGRLAWKSINAVISLSQQERMKGDPEYGDAVNRLRTRECTFNDTELFNSRLIKSDMNITGVDMGANNNNSATAIVSTNTLREAINFRKAHADSTGSGMPDLILCAALDKIISTSNSSQDIIHHLLNLNVSNLSRDGALPGYVPLFVGMPVILRYRNISTELGINNGSQGIVHQINTDTSPDGIIFCTSVIVEFPNSKANLPGLPPKYFVITPITWKFTTYYNGEKIQVVRQQLPLQPAFAVTGHSAQGKTLLKVLTGLHEGGFAAYVAASRATDRNGLYITEPVTLEMLNKPVPYDLFIENKRLKLIEHNTLVKYGFKKEPLKIVFDPESEHDLIVKTIHPRFDYSNDKPPPKTKKRKLDDTNITKSSKPENLSVQNGSTDTKLCSSTAKKQKISASLFSTGCTWTSSNWSCAYDVFFMIFFHLHNNSTNNWKDAWADHSLLASTLHQHFSELSTAIIEDLPLDFNIYRDQLRDVLSLRKPLTFPRFGAVAIDASDIFEQLNLEALNNRAVKVSYICPEKCHISNPEQFNEPLSLNIPTTIHPAMMTGALESEITMNTIFDIQYWVNAFINKKQILHHNITTCPNCTSLLQTETLLMCRLPYLHFEISPDMVNNVMISTKLNFKDQWGQLACYGLRGIIYLGQLHFTARLITKNEIIWGYDSQCNEGKPYLEEFISVTGNELKTFQNRSAYICVYQLII